MVTSTVRCGVVGNIAGFHSEGRLKIAPSSPGFDSRHRKIFCYFCSTTFIFTVLFDSDRSSESSSRYSTGVSFLIVFANQSNAS
jgi:hypothetical protein